MLRQLWCKAARFATVPAKRSMVKCSAGTSPEGHKGGGGSNLEYAGQFHRRCLGQCRSMTRVMTLRRCSGCFRLDLADVMVQSKPVDKHFAPDEGRSKGCLRDDHDGVQVAYCCPILKVAQVPSARF